MSKITEIFRQYGPRVAVFLAIFALVAWAMMALPKNTLFWEVLNLRFAKDERYQLQTLFLPDKRRQIPLLIVGDSLFHRTLAERLGKLPPHEAIVINGYDADDAAAIVAGVKVGMTRTKTKICSLIIQVSPLFSARTRGFDSLPAYQLLARANKNSVRNFFLILREWASTQDNGDLVEQAHMRRPAIVGQAKFADPDEENLNQVFGRLREFKGNVLAVLDDRFTDWGKGSNLTQATANYLDGYSVTHSNFRWTTIQSLGDDQIPRCRGR